MPIFELQNLSGDVIYRERVEYSPIIQWKRKAEKKVLRQVRKEKFWSDIRVGNVIVAWADYDVCHPTESDVQLVHKRPAAACQLRLVKKGEEYGIIASEGSQETVVKGKIMRYDRCTIVETANYSDRDVIFGKDMRQLNKWSKRYFGE